jgi:hypothetical protein
MLYELIYHSTTAVNFDISAIPEILEKSRIKNEQNQITGCLIYHEFEFLQILEGPEAAVKSLYARIEKDPRHGHISALAQGPIKERAFADWKMAFHCLGEKYLSEPNKVSVDLILGVSRSINEATNARLLFKILAEEILSSSSSFI